MKGCNGMPTNTRRFPLIADGEQVSKPSKTMALYENEDLITNIRGNYSEKDYNDVTQGYQPVENTNKNTHERIQTVNEGRSYAEIARDEARQDIKKKRQAYLVNENKLPSKPNFQKQLQATLPKKSSESISEFSHLADKIHQENYILAELPATYAEPNNKSASKKEKNSYDFLKHSQIYNKEAQQNHRERKIAQELNLIRFEDVN